MANRRSAVSTAISLSMALSFLSGLFTLPAEVCAQTPGYQDRLARIRDVTRNSELVLVWSEDDGSGTSFVNQRIYDLDLVQSDLSQRLAPKSVQADSIITGRRRIAVATGNFTGSSREHFVGAWTGPDGSITVAVPDLDAESLGWSDASHLTVNGPIAATAGAKLRLATGDFVGEGMRDEFVLGFQGDDGAIHLHVFGFAENSLDPELLGAINDEAVTAGHEAWDVVTGDFDGDSDDDLALLFIKPGDPPNWAVTAKIYSIGQNGSVVPGPVAEVFPRPGFQYSQVDLSGAAGDFDDDAAVEFAVAFTFAQDDPEPDTYLYVLDVAPDLSAIVTGDAMRSTRDAQNESQIHPINIAAGDLDGDYRDEIVMATAGAWQAYKVDDQLRPEPWKTGGAEQPDAFEDSDRFLALDDLDADGKAEIVVAGSFVQEESNGDQYLIVRVISLDANLIPRVIASRQNELPISNDLDSRHFAIALGDFDADRMHLGRPVHYRRQNVLQPSVVLNTPPVHYDVLGGTVYDLSGCFPDQQCGFSSSYTQTSSSELTVTVETHADWGVSATSSLDAEVLKLKATATYGEKFSSTATDKESITISTGRVAAGDDWIYASILDIDYYEYPVYDGDDPAPIGYYMVSIPGPVRPLWIESKDDGLLGNQFRPDHEVGNLLSYRAADAADLASPIVVFAEQTIGSTGSSFATLELSRFAENGAMTSWETSGEVSATAGLTLDIYGVEVGSEIETKGTFSLGEITTQTVSVQEDLEMRADFGRLQTQFGTSATYQIEPYAYWTVYGALAIDYKVTFPTGPSSFWTTWYGGKTDVGLSLPWRYDVQKALPMPNDDPSYARRTRDIVVSKPDPVGGDTVRIGARVRNMGLAAITIPVGVDFYLGDPAAGGSLIASATTDSTIAAQGSENVFVEWAIPQATLLRNARIYVVLDAAAQLTNEVHAGNNVGWAPAVASGEPTAREPVEGPHRGAFVLRQAYPNPFHGRTTIALDVPEASHVILTVYDVIGRAVVTLAEEIVPAGEHHYTFDSAGAGTGVYFYRLVAQPLRAPSQVVRETRKMVLVR